MKVDQLKADVRYAQSSVESIRARQWQRERQARDRDELLSMRYSWLYLILSWRLPRRGPSRAPLPDVTLDVTLDPNMMP